MVATSLVKRGGLRQAQPDARLIFLGQQLIAAWANERVIGGRYMQLGNERCQAQLAYAVDVCGALVSQITEIPAKTLAGIGVKGIAAAWVNRPDPDDDDVLASILCDVLGMESPAPNVG
jgi:hypothetical protein